VRSGESDVYLPPSRGSWPPTDMEDVDLTPHILYLAVQRCRCSRSDERSHSALVVKKQDRWQLAGVGRKSPGQKLLRFGFKLLQVCDNIRSLSR
jgi:hypothetical protein